MIPETHFERIAKLNGAELYFEVHGTGEPLLLLSGFSGTSQDWKPSLEQWGEGFQFLLPDLRGHGRSSTLIKSFRHEDAALDMFALLDHLGIASIRAVGISGGGNVLLHMATKQPARVKAMALVSATPYFPEQTRAATRQYAANVPEQEWARLHPRDDAQVA